MGSTGYQHGTTFTEAMRYELPPDVYKILAKAEGEPEWDRKVTWFAVERIDNGDRFIAQALWYPQTREYGVTIKLQDESVGPSDVNVPDKVWDKVPVAIPDADGYVSEYAVEWRRQVAEHKARYPLAIRSDLVQGEWYVFPDREAKGDDHAVQYLGEQRSGRSTVKVFLYPPDEGWGSNPYAGKRYRLRRGQERHGRARIAEPSVLASTR
jgi:hypothetical protein